MPTKNAYNLQSNLTAMRFLRSHALSKKLRMTHEEQLETSRKLFSLSRKRVESLKKSHSNKRLKCIEKPSDDAWITSGKLGSREAVLVFRTNLLNSITTTPLIQEDSTAVVTRNSNSELPNDNSDLIDYMPSTSKRIIDFSKSYDNKQYVCDTINKNSAFLPPIGSCEGNTYVPKHKSCKNVKRKDITKVNESSKIHLNESMSSSDISTSSESDEVKLQQNLFESMKDAEYNKTLVEIIEHNDRVCESKLEANNVDNGEEVENESLCQVSNDRVHARYIPAVELQITYKFMQTETKLLRKLFIRHGLTEVKNDENFTILWTGVHLKPDILRNLAPYQRVNHFPRSYELTRKDRLYKNIERMQHLRGLKHFDIIPQSFVLPLEYKDLVSAHNKHRGPWIVKPAASSRGRGIFIVNTPDQIPQDEQVLVSKYVSDPLCIDGHKCDIRVYVLVTSFDPLIIYVYEEGLVRLATVKYDRKADNLWNPCMHLCNYSINKYHSDYIKSIDAHDEDVGHKWTLSALLRHLKSQECDTKQLMANIEDLIIKSVLACAQSIISACRMFVPSGNNCFELYGFDVLIDDSLKPWLLEVNLSPSMGVDTPLDAKVKSCLIADLLTCVGVPAYSPTMRSHYDSKWTRFRNVNFSRRTISAEAAGTSNTKYRRVGGNGFETAAPLTLEEQRIIRNARLQNARRGGFVRIFPTEDTMQRYGTFLDPATGIPISTSLAQGQASYSMILPHNYNQMLFNNLYGKDSQNNNSKEDNSQIDRMNQYERALERSSPILFFKKPPETKCLEEGKRLRKQIIRMIDNGSEMTQLQARQSFALYLEAILHRLTNDPKDQHEKIILKFLNRIGGNIKAPVFFRNLNNIRVISKARSAMVAKLLGDFLEQYTRDTEAYIDSFDHFCMIPTSIFNEFLLHAEESDLEAVLALHTNLTGNMPYLYNRCGLSVPSTPPIPSGSYGFLKALPAMVIGGSGARDFNKYDGYYKSSEKEIIGTRLEKSVHTGKKSFVKR